MKERKIIGRIRYQNKKLTEHDPYDEYYVFEIHVENDPEWGANEWSLECAFPLKDDMIHYTALTQIRKWQQLGVDFHFVKGE